MNVTSVISSSQRSWPYSLGQSTSTTVATAPMSLDQAITKIAATYATPSTAVERALSWKNLLDLLASPSQTHEEKQQAKAFLEQFLKKSGPLPQTPSQMIDILKKFSKVEAIFILQAWIQTNTNPQLPNLRYYNPEEFMRLKHGDCTEVAWLAENIFRELGITTDVYILQYRLDYGFENQISGHALTLCTFTEEDHNYQYFFDNSQVFSLTEGSTVKNNIWQIYGENIWAYREINTSRWTNGLLDANDPQLANINSFTIYVPIPRDIALRAIQGLGQLAEFFENTDQDQLFFRDDFRQTILEYKNVGRISPENYTLLLDLWRQYENDGTSLY